MYREEENSNVFHYNIVRAQLLFFKPFVAWFLFASPTSLTSAQLMPCALMKLTSVNNKVEINVNFSTFGLSHIIQTKYDFFTFQVSKKPNSFSISGFKYIICLFYTSVKPSRGRWFMYVCPFAVFWKNSTISCFCLSTSAAIFCDTNGKRLTVRKMNFFVRSVRPAKRMMDR